METENIFFESTAGGRLAGVFHFPPQTPKAVFITCHGFLSAKGSHAKVAQMLAEKGFAALRFDFYGCGESGGDFENVTVSRFVADLEGAMDYVKVRVKMDKLIVYGSSLGGMVALLGAAKRKDIRALVLRAPLSDFSGLWKGMAGNRMGEWERKGFLDMELFGIKFRLGYGFYRDAAHINVHEMAKKITAPAIIFHGDRDSVVPLEQSRRLAASLANSRLVVFEGAGHRFEEGEEKRMTEGIAGFLRSVP